MHSPIIFIDDNQDLSFPAAATIDALLLGINTHSLCPKYEEFHCYHARLDAQRFHLFGGFLGTRARFSFVTPDANIQTEIQSACRINMSSDEYTSKAYALYKDWFYVQTRTGYELTPPYLADHIRNNTLSNESKELQTRLNGAVVLGPRFRINVTMH